MKQLISTIKLGIGLLLCSLCIIACTDNDWNNIGAEEQGKAIELFVSAPNNHAVSRASGAIKEEFETNDRIHLSITFTDINDKQTTVYSCLKYTDDEKWIEDGTKNFNWPWNAKKADFTAYFIPKSGTYNNNSNIDDNGEVLLSLSNLSSENKDPLIATYTNVPAGASVYLQFAHLFSKVTFTKLNQKDAITSGEELNLLFSGLEDQWKIIRKGGQLEIETSEQTGYIRNTCNDAFETTFLIPEINKDTKLRIARRDMSPLHSFALPLKFMAGKHYKVDITTLHDNYLSDEVREEDWNEKQDEITLTPTEIGKYLVGVSKGTEYSVVRADIEVPILITYEKDSKQIVAQVRDVNFAKGTFTPPDEVLSTVIFNGNNHYIKNVKLTNVTNKHKAIFAVNNGEMKNLIIENAETEDAPSTSEAYLGVLIGQNNGKIENIHLKGDISLTSGTSARYVGALIGWNQSDIQNSSVTGNFTLNVQHTNQETLYVGGLVGFATGTFTLQDSYVQVETGNAIRITGKSDMPTFVGGLIGQNAEGTAIQKCWATPDLIIDMQDIVHTGGFVGLAKGDLTGNTSTGNINCSGNINIESTIGGFIGTSNANITDCAAIGSITGTFNANANVGGLAGKLYAQYANINIKFSSATGQNLSDNINGLIGIGMIEAGKAITISNCFSLTGEQFINSTDNITIENCHLKGIHWDKDESFTPSSDADKWTNDPPIYGQNKNGNNIYYLKRGTQN